MTKVTPLLSVASKPARAYRFCRKNQGQYMLIRAELQQSALRIAFKYLIAPPSRHTIAF
jgi:hypothetical protein